MNDCNDIKIQDIVLSFRERMLLRRVRWIKNSKVKATPAAEKLDTLRLIVGNGDTLDAVITDRGKEYLINRMDRYVEARLPVAISVIALIRSFWPNIIAICERIIETIAKTAA